MSLNNLVKRAKAKNDEQDFPEWVSKKNITFSAYSYINQLKLEKLEFIAKHNKINDYKTKGNYQMTAAEVARHINAATTTLISTSAYSCKLKDYLDKVNDELKTAKENKLDTHKKTLDAGMKQRKKDEIRVELQNTKIELENLRKNNALEQATLVLQNLALPIKQKLGIDI